MRPLTDKEARLVRIWLLKRAALLWIFFPFALVSFVTGVTWFLISLVNGGLDVGIALVCLLLVGIGLYWVHSWRKDKGLKPWNAGDPVVTITGRYWRQKRDGYNDPPTEDWVPDRIDRKEVRFASGALRRKVRLEDLVEADVVSVEPFTYLIVAIRRVDPDKLEQGWSNPYIT